MIWHWKIALILSSSIKANFSQWIQMQCHYYFSWEVFCTAIRNFGTEKGKYHSDQSRSTLAAGKQFHKIFQFTNILRAAKFAVKIFENDLQSHYLPHYYSFIFGEWCTFWSNHLSFRIIMFVMSFKNYWLSNQRWCWLSEWKYWLKSLGIAWNLDQTGKAFEIVMFVDEAGHE